MYIQNSWGRIDKLTGQKNTLRFFDKIPRGKPLILQSLNSKPFSLFAPAATQDFSAVGRAHTLAETVPALSHNFGWCLKMLFHAVINISSLQGYAAYPQKQRALMEYGLKIIT